MANLYFNPEQYRNTLADLDKAIELSPNNFPFIEKRREIYLEKGDTAKAEADYNRLKEINPEFAQREEHKKARQEALDKVGPSVKRTRVFMCGVVAGIVFGIFFGKAHWGILGTILFTVGMAVAGFIVGCFIDYHIHGNALSKAYGKVYDEFGRDDK